MKSNNKSLLAQIGLLVTAMIWGTAFVVAKNATADFSPNYMIAIRFLIGALILGAVFHRRLGKIGRGDLKSGLILGVLLFSSYYVQTVGVKYTTAGNNAFLTAVYVVLVPFFYWFVRHKRPDFYNLAAAVFCIAGIGLISLKMGNTGFSINIGDLFSLISGFLFAMHIVAITIFTEKRDPILLTVLQFCVCSILAFAFALSFDVPPQNLKPDAIFSILYLGIFSTAIALGLQTVCQKYTPASKASIIMSLESVFGCLSGAVFLGEPLTPKIVFGFLLIFIAILLSETKLSFLKPKAVRRQIFPSPEMESVKIEIKK